MTLPPHPATTLHNAKPLVPFFSARDKLTAVPETCSDLEAEILMASHGMRLPGEGYSLSGSPTRKKLAGLRCLWWGWIAGRSWDVLQGLTATGDATLKAWLVAQETTGNADAARRRREWYPTATEIAAEQRAIQERVERVKRHEALTAEQEAITATLAEIALRIGRGANNLDDLLVEIRRLTVRYDEIAALLPTLEG